MKRTMITLALTLSILSISAVTQQPKAQWEYKVVVGKCWDEKKINPLGAEGWELTTYTTWGTSGGPVDTCVFKRQK
jgi:hypothetical protein